MSRRCARARPPVDAEAGPAGQVSGAPAVLTGATSGIGRWIALGLADAGRPLLLLGRDAARLAALADWVGLRVAGAQVETVAADLSCLAEVRAAAGLIRTRTARLGLLVNNAGLLSPHRVLTGEGIERTLAVNHLAPFVLTRSLLPALAATPGARIINVGSSTSDRARIDPDDLQLARGWRMTRAYARSKLALLMASRVLAAETGNTGPAVLVAHPGTVATSLVREPASARIAWRLMAPFLLSERQGADTPLHAALAPTLPGPSGSYLKKRRPVAPNPLALDPALCRRVVAATERLARPWLD